MGNITFIFTPMGKKHLASYLLHPFSVETYFISVKALDVDKEGKNE